MVVTDLALYLQHRYREGGEKLFYPNGGHLTARGHEIVAEYLMEALSD